MDDHITISVPHIQCLRNLDLLPLIRTYTPDKNKSPEKINDETPKPRWMKKSLSHAPILLSKLSGFTFRDANSVNVLWSAWPVNKKDIKDINSSNPKINKRLPKINFCWLESVKEGFFTSGFFLDFVVDFFLAIKLYIFIIYPNIAWILHFKQKYELLLFFEAYFKNLLTSY